MTDDNLNAENLEFHLVTILEKLEVLRREKISENGQKKAPMRVELRTFEFWKALISESIASFVYTFLVCGANAASRMGNTSAANVFLFTAITSGFVMMFLTQFFAHVSGAHVNPAVTIAMGLIKRISLLRTCMFMISQCGGAIAGAAFLYGAITIGATYCACSLVFMPYLNPARALGPAFVLNKWEAHWVDWLGPLLGGLIAGLVYEYIFNPHKPKAPKKEHEEEASSIPSDDELNYDDLDKPQAPKFHGSTYNTYRSTTGIEARANYCPSLYSAPPARLERVESIYGGTKSLCRSPPLTRANLNRSQSVYTKSNTAINRELLPKPGPLVPAQSLYPMRLNQQSHIQNQNVHNQLQQRSEQIYGVRGVTPGTAASRPDNYVINDRPQPRDNYASTERARRDNYASTENPYVARTNPPSSSDSSENNPPPARTRRPESFYASLGSQARNLQSKQPTATYPENRTVYLRP
ncbi:hypothetical protein YQE_09109, partial [Dendroctonus ponderosae]